MKYGDEFNNGFTACVVATVCPCSVTVATILVTGRRIIFLIMPRSITVHLKANKDRKAVRSMYWFGRVRFYQEIVV